MFLSYHKAPARYAVAMSLFVRTPSTPVAESLIDPERPFRMGEGYAERPATCETIRRWIDHAPATDDRITLTITGRLAAVDWDGMERSPIW